MRIVAIVMGVVFTPLAWAGEHRVAVPARSDLAELTTEAFRVVPALTGAHEEVAEGVVVFDNAHGEFTPEEQALLEQAVAAHDPQAKAKRRARQAAARASGDAKLKALLGLTDEELAARR